MSKFEKIFLLKLTASLTFKIHTAIEQLPSDWDVLSDETIFLSVSYLRLLDVSAPLNMRCYFISMYNGEELVGIALSQFLDLSQVESYGDRDSCLKTKIRNIAFKNFSSKVLFIGNNMLTGQNAYAFSNTIAVADGLITLQNAVVQIKEILKAEGIKTHLFVWKDFSATQSDDFKIRAFNDYYAFGTQPNMVLEIPAAWQKFDDYIDRLLKKYRDQYKRARKKAEGLTKRKLSVEEISQYNTVINKLYLTVANNAPFNTFYLPENHFIDLKKQLKDHFLFYGYFNGDTLIGFNTLIKNGADIDTYFLGYDEQCQREKMLYLNMLYDMVAYSINKGYSRIIFARTALEIKSSVGAKPKLMTGFIKHNNPIINFFMSRLFKYFEPETIWQERHPFKD